MVRIGKAPATTMAVVLPCYRETGHILKVIAAIGKEVDRIYVIDDACPDHTGEHVRANCRDKRVEVLEQMENTGVGGATMAGYRKALADGAQIIVKLDGDGQMDPALIPDLIAPITDGRADYTKGNRFYTLDRISEMPRLRIIGNLALSFITKLSSGYWNIFDPTNGFTAIHGEAARRLPLDKINNGFFFESDMLFRLYLERARVIDVPMPPRYGEEESSLSIRKIIFEFAGKHLLNASKRIFYTYFLRDFGVPSIELAMGNILVLLGGIYGLVGWRESSTTGIPATAGTVLLAALPIIIGSQLLISFIDHDVRNVPDRALHRKS